MALIGPAVLEKIFENGGRRTTDGRTDDGPWLYYKLTNELKIVTCSRVTAGIFKYISFGTLLLRKFASSVISASRHAVSLLPKISEMEGKYSFILVAISSEDVCRSLFMTISSGKLLFELLSLLLILRKSCHIALVSFEFITES